jgi:Ribosomal protein L22p/L17e
MSFLSPPPFAASPPGEATAATKTSTTTHLLGCAGSGCDRRFFSSATSSGPPSGQRRMVLSPTSATLLPTAGGDGGTDWEGQRGDPRREQKWGVILDNRWLPKLKPGVVARRVNACRTYVGRETAIRQSPWKLNRICQLAAGLTLEEALTQLKFCDLKNADLVGKVLKRTSNLADIRDGLQISQLEVAECFATKAMMLRRMKLMGRGR